MSTNDTARVSARSLAEQRLRRITIGTTVVGIVATVAFSTAAAMTQDASGDETSAALVVSGSTPSPSDAPTTSASATSSTAPTVAGATGSAHATTGGS